jgi:phosphoribosylaminoimidazole carboxylase PurK protein
MEGNRIGIVGGGQLGRMLTEAAKPMGFEITVLETGYPSPAAQAGARQIEGSIKDPAAIRSLAGEVDVMTWEIEHIDTEALSELAIPVHPAPETLVMIKDKLQQKQYLRQRGIPVADYAAIEDDSDIRRAFHDFGSVILKTRFGGYDGRGNQVLRNNPEEWPAAREKLGVTSLYAEQVLPFQKELAVIAARNRAGDIATYPVVETVQKDNICHIVLAPADIVPDAYYAAEEIAHETLKHMQGAGVFGIEMFLTEDDEVVVNEIAPRVHNSGHHTIEANKTSQFEQHIRAITGLPLGSTEMIAPAAMINILGERNGEVELKGLDKVLAIPDAHVHLYGKSPTKVARKMGHITVRAHSVAEARELAIKAREELEI